MYLTAIQEQVDRYFWLEETYNIIHNDEILLEAPQATSCMSVT